jgi:hypothetical protein
LLDFFNQLGKTPTGHRSLRGGNGRGATHAAELVNVKEEPLSEEDLRALQKDRQKKDSHNISEETKSSFF